MFIKINGTILDEREYSRKVILLKRLVQFEFSESIGKYGFRKEGNYYVHLETGMRVMLLFEKPKGKPL